MLVRCGAQVCRQSHGRQVICVLMALIDVVADLLLAHKHDHITVWCFARKRGAHRGCEAAAAQDCHLHSAFTLCTAGWQHMLHGPGAAVALLVYRLQFRRWTLQDVICAAGQPQDRRQACREAALDMCTTGGTGGGTLLAVDSTLSLRLRASALCFDHRIRRLHDSRMVSVSFPGKRVDGGA